MSLLEENSLKNQPLEGRVKTKARFDGALARSLSEITKLAEIEGEELDPRTDVVPGEQMVSRAWDDRQRRDFDTYRSVSRFWRRFAVRAVVVPSLCAVAFVAMELTGNVKPALVPVFFGVLSVIFHMLEFGVHFERIDELRQCKRFGFEGNLWPQTVDWLSGSRWNMGQRGLFVVTASYGGALSVELIDYRLVVGASVTIGRDGVERVSVDCADKRNFSIAPGSDGPGFVQSMPLAKAINEKARAARGEVPYLAKAA